MILRAAAVAGGVAGAFVGAWVISGSPPTPILDGSALWLIIEVSIVISMIVCGTIVGAFLVDALWP